jgi:hypothetical protein
MKTKVILGWLLKFRMTTIALPKNNFIAYSHAISDMIEQKRTSKAALKKNIR